MFNFFKRKRIDTDIVNALTSQAIGGQSLFYKIFRKVLGCEDTSIRRLELTYFVASVMTYVYLRIGKEPNREEILDRFAKDILIKSIPSSKEQISFNEVVKEFQDRYAEYNKLLPFLLDQDKNSSGDPATTLLIRAFQWITDSSPRERMIKIVASSDLVLHYFIDQINFVKEKL
jgi:hypothetical protein